MPAIPLEVEIARLLLQYFRKYYVNAAIKVFFCTYRYCKNIPAIIQEAFSAAFPEK